MPTPHCSLCGCHAGRPCLTVGRAFAPGDRSARTRFTHAGERQVWECQRSRTMSRCSNCQHCEQCGAPLDDHAQCIVVAGRKHRLCGTARPCDCGEKGCTATVQPCRITHTGDPLFDALLEADRFGDASQIQSAFSRWLAADPERSQPNPIPQ